MQSAFRSIRTTTRNRRTIQVNVDNDQPDLARVNKTVCEWLSRHGLPSTKQTESLRGDASDRRFVRVRLSSDTSRVLVVHKEAIDENNLPLLQIADLLQRIPIAIPTIYGVDADLGIIEVEDLGDETLETAVSETADESKHRATYEKAVNIIVDLQRGGRLLQERGYKLFNSAFDKAKFLFELEFFLEQFIEKHRQTAISEKVRSTIMEEFSVLASEMADEPRVVCHRDFHSRNLMKHRQQLYVIDYQDTRLGPDMYDLASLLRDSYVELPTDTVEHLLIYYAKSMKIDYNTNLRERFVRTALQRNLKALGTFGYQIAVQDNHRYKDAVTRTVSYVKRTLQTDSRYTILNNALSSVIDELQS